MTEILRKRLEERLETMGLSASKVSREATGSPDTIRSWFNNPDRSPRVDTLAKVAVILETTPEWLLGRIDNQATSNARTAPIELPPRQTMPADVPVLGTAAGSLVGGAFQIEGGVIDYVRRPPALSGARDVYALYIEGTSMEPLFRPGGLVFVHPHKPPRIGDSVVVQMRNGEHENVQASIGYLRARTADNVVLGKLNPVSDIRLNRSLVMAVHRVLDMNELFGV